MLAWLTRGMKGGAVHNRLILSNPPTSLYTVPCVYFNAFSQTSPRSRINWINESVVITSETTDLIKCMSLLIDIQDEFLHMNIDKLKCMISNDSFRGFHHTVFVLMFYSHNVDSFIHPLKWRATMNHLCLSLVFSFSKFARQFGNLKKFGLYYIHEVL